MVLLITIIIKLNAQVWTTVTTPSTTGIEDMAVANNKLYIAASNGVYSSTDGVTWTGTYTGMTVTAGYTFSSCIYNYNNIMYSGAMGKSYKSVDFGANWTIMTDASPSASAYNTSTYANGDTIYTGWGSSTGIKTSIDGGLSWTFKALPVIDKDIVTFNGAVYVKTQSGVFKSIDNATNFTQLAGGLPTFSGVVGALTLSNGVLLCAIYTYGLYVSSDEGTTWTQISTASGLTSNNVGSFHVEGGSVYLGCSTGEIFQSLNNGTTWTEITGINNGSPKKCFAIFNGELYAGGTYGLYKTTLGTSINENVQAIDVFSISPNPANNDVTITSQEIFNNATFKIYSVTGKLFIEKRLDGSKQQTISVTNLSNGIYVVEINQNGITLRQKIIKN